MSYRRVLEEINDTLKVMGSIKQITLSLRYDYGGDEGTVDEYKDIKFGKSYGVNDGKDILDYLFSSARDLLDEVEDETGISSDGWEDGSDDDYRYLELIVVEIKFVDGLTWYESDLNYIIEPNFLIDN